MSKVLRKRISIKSNCQLNIYGGAFGPIRTPFYETVVNIGRLISDGIEVYEHTTEGEVRLTMANFDKDLTKKEEVKPAVAARSIEVEPKKETVVTEQRQQPQQQRQEQQQQRQRDDQYRNNKNNKQYQKNNNDQRQQQPANEVKADVIVEE